MNLRDCVWEIQYQIIMKTILQRRRQFITALQLGSQVYSYASSYENSCSKSSGGQGMRKIGEIFGVAPDESQKQIRGDR